MRRCRCAENWWECSRSQWWAKVAAQMLYLVEVHHLLQHGHLVGQEAVRGRLLEHHRRDLRSETRQQLVPNVWFTLLCYTQ